MNVKGSNKMESLDLIILTSSRTRLGFKMQGICAIVMCWIPNKIEMKQGATQMSPRGCGALTASSKLAMGPVQKKDLGSSKMARRSTIWYQITSFLLGFFSASPFEDTMKSMFTLRRYIHVNRRNISLTNTLIIIQFNQKARESHLPN